MSIQLDFIKQLTTTKAVKEEANKINKKSIKGTYNTLIDSPFLFGNNRAEFEKLEDKIKLKFSYLCLLIILEDYSEDCEIEKEDLRDKAQQIYKSAESYKEVLREKNKNKCKYINPYQNLLVGNSSTKLEITRGYERQLSVISKMLEFELGKKNIDPRQLIESYSTFLLQEQSFGILIDPIEKRRIDEEILINFNPNQENLYIHHGIEKIEYFPEDNENIYKMVNKFNDVIFFQKIGTLEYENFSVKDNSTLQNYRIKKEYHSFSSGTNELEKEYNIFTYLNIAKLTSNPEFTALHADILFSDLNLEEAQKHNGGYIGEIVKSLNGKFDVYHDQEKLCACKEYQNRILMQRR